MSKDTLVTKELANYIAGIVGNIQEAEQYFLNQPDSSPDALRLLDDSIQSMQKTADHLRRQ